MALLDEPILKRNIFQILGDCAVGAVELAGKVVEGATSGVEAITGGFKDASVSLGSFFSPSNGAPEPVQAIAPAKEQTVEVMAPSNKYEVPMADLGCLSAPSFGSCSRGGTGLGV
jgi:hypothetical protein